MKTSLVSRRTFLTGLGVAAAIPVVAKASSATPASSPTKSGHSAAVSGKVLAAQWKVLAETTLAGQVPPGLARQIYRRLLINA